MRVARNTADTLVIEEGVGTKFFLGSFFTAIGAAGVLVWWKEEKILFLIVGSVFALYGAKMLLFSRTRTHRFERWRGRLTIEAKGLWGTRRRELPLDSIVDIILEEIRSTRMTSYYIYHVTRDGRRIRWAETFDGSKENTLECFREARKFLGLPEAPAAVDGALER